MATMTAVANASKGGVLVAAGMAAFQLYQGWTTGNHDQAVAAATALAAAVFAAIWSRFHPGNQVSAGDSTK